MVLSSIVVVAVVAVAGRALVAQQPAAGPKVADDREGEGQPLHGARGGGGNTAVFVTANGVVLVDTKLADWGQAILDKVKTVTDKPVTHIINTHTHGDHVGSNDFFPASVEIVAHANVTTSMEKMPQLRRRGEEARLARQDLHGQADACSAATRPIDLYHFGPAHTNGDTFVVFRSAAGDARRRRLRRCKGTPFIDRNNGGSGVAYPETLAKAAAGIKDVDTVIPGHSAVTTLAAFVEFGEFNKAFLTAVQDAKKAGKTSEQAAAELKLPEKFKDYNVGRAKVNAEAIYADLP